MAKVVATELRAPSSGPEFVSNDSPMGTMSIPAWRSISEFIGRHTCYSFPNQSVTVTPADRTMNPWPVVAALTIVCPGSLCFQNRVNRQYQTLGFGKLVRIDHLVNQRYGIGAECMGGVQRRNQVAHSQADASPPRLDCD